MCIFQTTGSQARGCMNMRPRHVFKTCPKEIFLLWLYWTLIIFVTEEGSW